MIISEKYLLIYNGNWTEWSAIWLKSYAWFQNGTSAQREFDLKSQVWFQTKIAQHEVQLPLYYTHFEISQFFVNINIYLSTSENPVSFSFWWAKKDAI